jgi:hypothetical protein
MALLVKSDRSLSAITLQATVLYYTRNEKVEIFTADQ